jgi:glycine oxidase
VFSEKGYVVPRADGRVLCGSTMEEAGHERAITAGGVRSVLDLAIEIAPTLINAPLIDAWCNFRPASPDGWPILGASTVEGLYYATGHTRNGILLCPITAEAVSASILGRTSPVDLAPFSVRRLVTPHG